MQSFSILVFATILLIHATHAQMSEKCMQEAYKFLQKMNEMQDELPACVEECGMGYHLAETDEERMKEMKTFWMATMKMDEEKKKKAKMCMHQTMKAVVDKMDEKPSPECKWRGKGRKQKE